MHVKFGDFVLDRGTRQLRCGEEDRYLRPKAFALLELLIEQRPNVVARERIRDSLWPATFVSESTLGTVVGEIRAALGESSREPRFVRTVHGVGFAFCGEATESGPPDQKAGASAYRLVVGDQEVPLRQGENILGRVEGGIVWLESSTVSRRHARITVEGGEAFLEDLGSKNGTLLRGERISAPTLLADGDVFRLGRVTMRLRAVHRDGTTHTDDA